MSTRVARWGNSLGIRVPRHVAAALGLKAGQEVFIRLDSNSRECIMKPVLKDSIDDRYFSPVLSKDDPIQLTRQERDAALLTAPEGW